MDFKQPQEDHRQPQNEQHCPNAPPEEQEAAEAAALGEQGSSAEAQSYLLSLQNSCSLPDPGEEAWASNEEEREVCHPLEPCRGENHLEHALSQGDVNRMQNLPQGENDSNKSSPPENWRRITIRTVWINPKYPELFQSPLQEEAKAATPSASDEQVPAAAGAQSPAQDSPCCSTCSSRTQLAAQTRSDPQGVRRRPSSSRRALRALCTLLWCFCMEVQLQG